MLQLGVFVDRDASEPRPDDGTSGAAAAWLSYTTSIALIERSRTL